MAAIQPTADTKAVGGKSELIHPKLKYVSHALPKISINMGLATEILLSESRKGSSGKNVVCSPLSLEFALHMVAAGSKGETLSQILKFIGTKDNPLLSMEDLTLKSSGIMRVASSYCKCDSNESKKTDDWVEEEEEPKLSFANGVWVDQCFDLKPSYKELMISIYGARAEVADFEQQADQIVLNINSWVADKTKGLIKQILRRLNPSAMLILVNALYFKGVWSSPFEKEWTRDMDFHLLDGSKVSAPFMWGDDSNLFGAFDGFKVIKLFYQRGKDKLRKFSMQILLPDEIDGLHDLLNKCISDPEFLNQDFGLKYEELECMKIPKFRFSYTIKDVQGMMEGLGLTQPFMPECRDLTEMVELELGASLRVSRILHKAIIEVDEAGTEAAAVTEVDDDMGCSLSDRPRRRFIADHPFIFFIKEEMSGAIFFVGAVLNPLHEH